MNRVQYFYDPAVRLPRLAIDLVSSTTQKKDLSALVDSASTTSVIPYTLGRELGLEWDESIFPEIQPIRGFKTLGVMLGTVFQDFGLIELGFSWVQSDTFPLILGQIDFFQHFRICFDAEGKFFTVERKQNA